MKSSPLNLPTLLVTNDVVRKSNIAAYNKVVESVLGKGQDEGSLV